uniref:Uncharacterized protein n=1 Tax=Pan troglodytes TaxID=9598 RepID=A0A2I3RZQ3_PANTR
RNIIRLVYKEVTTLTADPPDGIKVFPNEETDSLPPTQELLPDQDLQPRTWRQWRDLRQRAQEGLDS